MSAFRTRWTARWRALRGGAWLPTATAAAQLTLVVCAAIATTCQTVGYVGRSAGLHVGADDLGYLANNASLVAFLAAFTAYLIVSPLTWSLIWVSLRRVGGDLENGPRRRRAAWRRTWWLVISIFVPPVVGALLSGERALVVPPMWTLVEVPVSALALWALGAYLLLGYWMRRMCLLVGLVGLATYTVCRRFELVPSWMVEWPRAGGALKLSAGEAAYLSEFTVMEMIFGFVILISMMLAARPLMAPGPVVVAPPPLPPLPGPTPPATTPQPEPQREVQLPRHPSGRVIRRMDV